MENKYTILLISLFLCVTTVKGINTHPVNKDAKADLNTGEKGSLLFNINPVVYLTKPQPGDKHCSLSPITLEAYAIDPDGAITNVLFVIDNKFYPGVKNGDLYSVVWTPAEFKTYPLQVVAFGSIGTESSTANASITIEKGILNLDLYNAATDSYLRPLVEDDTIYIDEIVDIVAFNTAPAASVKFTLNNISRIESAFPYSLAGDFNGNLNPWSKVQGRYALTATPYSGKSGGGTAGCPTTVNFSVVDPADPVKALSFTLVDSKSDTDIRPLHDNDTIYYDPVTANVTIKANTNSVTQSVQFYLNGSLFKTESTAPFVLSGDNGGNYNPWNPQYKTYVLTAKAYVAKGAGGQQIDETTINLVVLPPPVTIAMDTESSPVVYPNPTEDMVTIKIPDEAASVVNSKNVAVQIVGKDGFVHYSGTLPANNGNIELSLDQIGIPSGLYIIHLMYEDKVWVVDLFKK